MGIKITTLIEDTSEDSRLKYEHGLSIYIETPYCNILFDTGSTGNFVYNAKTLGIDLNKTNYMILSHAHYDHCGGVRKFFDQVLYYPEVYINKYFFKNSNKFKILKDNSYKYLGIDFDENYFLEKNIPINYLQEDIFQLEPSIYLCGNFNKETTCELENDEMLIKKGDGYVQDTFKEEITLVMDTDKGLVVLLGCSHVGVISMLESIKRRLNKNIYAILGGTHLINADEKKIKKVIKKLESMNIKLIGVSHCTGELATNSLKQLKDRFFINCTGTRLEII
ncbi:MBL fold metallo-hydrolase [Clostridium niameyense]|uniref:MBL fold metallo-hydrolase n=1 Tax=Clostridium niameyense TaxID=1622073 RepID=A0A6M0RCI6_9CLOT|nr:MBL fold metallo-hydrolase [Clostridium niameyense]NEZ47517.1 MBL fold metallo-hydrolase [Clostridium niameyense]